MTDGLYFGIQRVKKPPKWLQRPPQGGRGTKLYVTAAEKWAQNKGFEFILIPNE